MTECNICNRETLQGSAYCRIHTVQSNQNFPDPQHPVPFERGIEVVYAARDEHGCRHDLRGQVVGRSATRTKIKFLDGSERWVSTRNVRKAPLADSEGIEEEYKHREWRG